MNSMGIVGELLLHCIRWCCDDGVVRLMLRSAFAILGAILLTRDLRLVRFWFGVVGFISRPPRLNEF